MASTYSKQDLAAQSMTGLSSCFFTAAGRNGYRLYTGTPKAMTFAGFYKTFDELFTAAAAINA